MKKILIVRGDIENPIILGNGDKYDSTLILSDSNLKTLFVSGKVNTDHTSSYRGGIIAEGSYFAICGILEDINKNIIDEVLKLKPQKVIALDKIFNGNDQLKTNTVLQFKDAAIEFKSV